MKNQNLKIKESKKGRPKLNIDKTFLAEEIQKYLNKEQTGVQTYNNLGIGKTSFYAILRKMEVKSND